MFSPILPIVSARASPTVCAPTLCALIASTSVPTSIATWAIIFTRPWNRSLRATKSVSELTSTTAPLVPARTAPIRPSAATRPAFLAAFASPFLRSQSTPASMSPPVSFNAALQSIMPAPVFSRSSLTISAVIFWVIARNPRSRWWPAACATAIGILLGFGVQFLGFGNPAIDTAGKADLFAHLVGGIRPERRDLPEMENAEVVELLLDRRRDAVQLLEIVGNAARTGELLEAKATVHFVQGNIFDDRRLGGSDIGPQLALRARDAIDRRLGNEIAIKRDRAARIVVARNHEGDSLRIAIGIDDGGDGNVEPLRFLDRDVFLVGIDHEQQVGQPTHVLDAAERSVELFTFARQRETFFLGVALRLAGIENLVELAQALDRAGNGLPVGQRTAEPTLVDVVLGRLLGGLGDCVLGLAFCADKQDAAAAGHGIAHGFERLVQHRHRLREIDDVNIVAGTEDELAHLRVPAVGLMTKMNTSLKQLAHGIIGQRHVVLRLCRRGTVGPSPLAGGARPPDGTMPVGRRPRSACEMVGLI